MKESVLVGRCRENNKYIFFLVRKNAQLGCQNDVLIVPLIAHFMCHNSKPFISRICFYGPELNHIHPVNQALCYTLDADHFFNDGTFSLATRSHEFTTTSKQQFLVDGNNVTVSFDIRRDFSSKISDAPVHLNSALTFEFDPSDNYMFLLRLYNIAKRFIQFLCYRADINISTTNLYELTDDDKYSNYAHGNLDKEFIGNSLLDLVYLQRIVYAMQLSYRRTALMQLSFAEICRLILCHPVDSAICRAILIWINQFGIHVIIPAQALTAPVTKIHIFTFHCHMAFGTNRITCFVRENHDLFYWHLQPIASKHPKHSSAGAHFWPY